MTTLTRPRRVGFGGMGDFEFPSVSASDFTIDAPTAVDWSNLSLPGGGSTSSPFDFSKLTNDLVKGAQTYYGAQTAVNNANYASQLAKARAQAAVNVAKAGGSNAALSAKAGLPSPTLLLAAGVTLGAVLLLRR